METAAGGELTVDHFRPRVHGGTDDITNLLYYCYRCNLYKADYWPLQGQDPTLWNPLQEPPNVHFVFLDDGLLAPITSTGALTIARLRLNRPPLVRYRLQRQVQEKRERLLTRYRDLMILLEQMNQQQARLLEEQRSLLQEQRALLRLLLKDESKID